jgi:hypothetical protein
MTTKLTSPLRREIEIDGEPFTLLLTPDGIRLTRKRFRGGRSLSWRSLWDQGRDELERAPRS